MKNQSRTRLLDALLVPPMKIVFFACSVIYRTVFSWWYNPWSQREANAVLWHDIQANMPFLVGKGKLVSEREVVALPFDYASVSVVYGSLRFCFTRGRGEFNVTILPMCAPNNSYHLDAVLAALESREISRIEAIRTLSEVANALRSHLDEIKEAFSETKFPEFRRKLL